MSDQLSGTLIATRFPLLLTAAEKLVSLILKPTEQSQGSLGRKQLLGDPVAVRGAGVGGLGYHWELRMVLSVPERKVTKMPKFLLKVPLLLSEFK